LKLRETESADGLKPLLEVNELKVGFERDGKSICVVDGVSFCVKRGETFCLVGESGCGKTVTALSIAKLLATPPAQWLGGQILLNGQDTLQMQERELRQVRGSVISYIFQEPGASLNPAFSVGSQVKDALKLHRPDDATDSEIVRLLTAVGIAAPELRMRDCPGELSGGMQQRVMIAIALASNPKLLVADEPTTALDVTIQAQILELLQEIKRRLGTTILLITHNLAIVSEIADHVAVMYAGQIVESAPAMELLRRPLHPYTKALIAAMPRLGHVTEKLIPIRGVVPSPNAVPSGCRFHPRCTLAQPDCSQTAPELKEVEPGHWVRCPYWQRSAPSEK